MVFDSGHGRPKVALAGRGVADFVRDRDRAIIAGDVAGRDMALWGLIELGSLSLPWCETALRSSDPEVLEDAAGVLAWVGTPDRLVSTIVALIEQLGDSQAADALNLALPANIAAQLSGDGPPVAHADGVGLLLGGSRDPFTEIIYFVRSPYERVLSDRRGWDALCQRDHHSSEHEGSLDALLDLLEPTSIPSWKVLYVETTGEWTAVFSQGSDLSYVAHFGARLKTVVVRTSHSPHIVRDGTIVRYGGTAMWITDGTREDLTPHYGLRSIQASRQSSTWQWDLDGEPQPFEDLDRYENRVIRERFDLPTLNAYCRALGIARDDLGFYGPRGTLFVEDTSEWSNRPAGIPSSEWRRRYS